MLPDAAVFLGGFSEDALKQADRVVLSPGIAVATPFIAKARALGLPVLGDIELFAHYAQAPVVGITGSNGKSTVTTLVGHMAERAGREVRIGGNLGTPALDLIQEKEPQTCMCWSSPASSWKSPPRCTAWLPACSTSLLTTWIAMSRWRSTPPPRHASSRHCDVAVVNRDDARSAQHAAIRPEAGELWFGNAGWPRLRCRDV